ncbi:acetyl-CoA carboxylase biotin carboxylase subunit [Bacillus aquiflavi]|uniref:biotin carboxylase n=1 Tax=Bacillus aquiflavi TaxID=2672567 RepID=A0A6B3W1W4_9BACI|nr:acetyl-CoA carboxylase biotin carboxylase subunit [Bacillus aquiflavi]MBA4537624.1 acetyl-CoA carboxylase biotin carboxylase subunit [Bacillus aquiflavi]NEY81881.1 acetyl-CoA carboxylase biotin carboxylase subunit [Bacillus aquiflavi]
MQKILIANRGEIASRIIKTCHEMNIDTVCIFSDADRDLPFVKEAKKAVHIGEAPVNKSYLKMDKIIEIAKKEQVDAIHPGYGLLSENAEFARKVEESGIIFIGPSPKTIELMGDKIASRQTMKQAGVPVVPGSDEGVSTLEEACLLANSIGYPVMLKASGGGGGIGMVFCENEQALVKSYTSTKGRAKAYFGIDTLFIEKYIHKARHIEVQIFGDKEGNLVHLFERECSIQRRHQKVIEESPSPLLSESTKQKMFATAIKAAAAVQYVNAGTVEFIVDEQENFYFLEMNTRLQVEHPVTEQTTNLDLVKWQIIVARNERLPLFQNEIIQKGHAIEFRIYAEDPKTFYPSPGKIDVFNIKTGDGIRIDKGYEAGCTVTPYYDPMIAKFIFNGNSREKTLQVANEYFEDFQITGIKTNVPLFREILCDEEFIKGDYSTSYLKNKQFLTK